MGILPREISTIWEIRTVVLNLRITSTDMHSNFNDLKTKQL